MRSLSEKESEFLPSLKKTLADHPESGAPLMAVVDDPAQPDGVLTLSTLAQVHVR